MAVVLGLDVPWGVRWAAQAAALSALPSGLWRISVGVGIPMGCSSQWLRDAHIPGWGSVYLVTISLVIEGLAFLTLGLVRPWGEVVPGWVPFVGGRVVVPRAAVIPAALGSAAVMALTFTAAASWRTNMIDTSPPDLAAWVMNVCYAPILAWGPLLGVVTIAYYRRRRRRPPAGG